MAEAIQSVRRILTATLLIGVPGSGKTSLLATLARYLWEAHDKKVLLLYSWDGGAIPTLVQKLVKQGLIRFWRVRTRSAEGLGIENLYQATKGYWPSSINAATGETSPGVRLVPPVTGAYYVRCRQGHLLATLPVRSQLAPTYCDQCRNMIQLGDQLVEENVRQTEGFERVGGVAYDGLTSMTGEVLTFLDHERGEGRIGGEKASHGAPIVSGDIRIGGNNRADIGLGQSRAKEFINNALSIPNLVEGPVFTALTMEASDEGGLSIVGPKLPGRAATDEAPAWVGNCFEMGKTKSDNGQEDLFTLFLRPFTDPQGRRHLLKTSASPTGLPDKLIDPVGQPWTQANLGRVFTLLDEDLRKALAEDDIPDAPGLAGTPTEYGGKGFSVTPPPPAEPASGIAPLTTPTKPLAPAAAAVSPTTTTTTTTTTMPIAAPMAIPRAKKAAVAAPAPPAAPTGNGDGGVVNPAIATAAPAPPAPPGMKPPQRAPGTTDPSAVPSSTKKE
jgi:hypothetical protein